jgi:spore maturation protein CgeB
MGNNYGNQFPLGGERQMLSNILLGKGYAVYGGYRGATGNLNGNQLAESLVYNNSKIAINHSHFNEERYTSDRMFRIMASWTMCLSHHYKGIERDFEIGEHLDTYQNIREMQNKINHYLANPNEAERIAENGYDYCHNTFTYKHMVNNLIELYNKYK